MRLADEGHHVMLAVRIERNVAHENHVVITVDLAEDAVQNVFRFSPYPLNSSS